MKLQELYLEDKSVSFCGDNPVMSVECDACDDMGLSMRETCCSDLLKFSDCHNQLVPLLRDLDNVVKDLPVIEETEEMEEPSRKRYASTFARWGYSKGYSPVQWGRPITARKRYGMASGRRFNFNRFKQGGYNHLKHPRTHF